MTDENKDYQKAVTGQPLALEKRDVAEDGRRYSPSTGRNKDVVREVFLREMPNNCDVLEIASGTGEHGAHITSAALELTWTYSDIDPASLASQRAWREAAAHDRLRGPLTIDTTDAAWIDADETWMKADQAGRKRALFCANMVHIAPFEAAAGLIAGAGRLLRSGDRIMLYGPFARKGDIAPSNARFSEDLKRRDPRWGVRDLDLEIVPLADAAGLRLHKVVDMPANNLSVIFETG